MKRQALSALRGLLVDCGLLTYGCATPTDPPRFDPTLDLRLGSGRPHDHHQPGR